MPFPSLLLAGANPAFGPASFAAGRAFFREGIGGHEWNVRPDLIAHNTTNERLSPARLMGMHTGESMSRGQRPNLIRAGRPAKLSRVLAQCNADAERMRREAEQRAQKDKPAPVVVRGATA